MWQILAAKGAITCAHMRRLADVALHGALVGLCVYILACAPVLAQATLVPNAVQQFLNANGNPLSAGNVWFYIPGTTTPKTVWQDSGQTTPYPNPIPLNAAGEPTSGSGIFGTGSYRQQVFDSLGNLTWDATTITQATANAGTAGDGMPIGFIMPFAGNVLPTGYDWAAGQAYVRANFGPLLSAITITQNGTCTNMSTNVTALTDTHQMGVGQAIESSCLPPGTTIASIVSATAITVSQAATATSGTYSLQVFPWGNGNGSTTFNLPDLRGYAIAGTNNMGAPTVSAASILTTATRTNGWNFPGASGGAETHTLTVAELASHNHPVFLNDPGHVHGGIPATAEPIGTGAASAAGGSGGNSASATTGMTVRDTIGGGGTANQTATAGSGSAHTIVQPTVTTNYIVKVSANQGAFTIPISNNSVLGNNSGVSAAPTAITAGAVLSMIGSTRGSVLEYGASGWQIITPGAAGQCFTSNGAGLDPAYAACGSGAITFTGTQGGLLYMSTPTTAASSAVLASNQLVLGGGSTGVPATLGSLGTTTTVLHGNAAGAPSFSAIVNGDITAGTITGASIASATITGSNVAANTVANSNLSQMAANSVKCNNTGGSATAIDCTQTQLTALVSPCNATTAGAVPTPPNNATTFLRGDCTFTATGGPVLLNTLTASNSASLADTTDFTSTYSEYEIRFENILPATNNTDCKIQVTSGSLQATTYLSSALSQSAGSPVYRTVTTYVPCSDTDSSVSNAGAGISGSIRLIQPSQTTAPKMFTGQFSFPSSGSPNPQPTIVSGFWNGGNGAVTGITVSMVAGNITSGTIKIYGLP